MCQEERRVLVSLDLDVANVQADPLRATVEIVVLRLVRQDKPRILEVIRQLVPALTENAVSCSSGSSKQTALEIADEVRLQGKAADPRFFRLFCSAS